MKLSRTTRVLILLCGVVLFLALLKQPSVCLLLRQNKKLSDSLDVVITKYDSLKKSSEYQRLDIPPSFRQLSGGLKDAESRAEYWEDKYYMAEESGERRARRLINEKQGLQANIDLLEDLLESCEKNNTTSKFDHPKRIHGVPPEDDKGDIDQTIG